MVRGARHAQRWRERSAPEGLEGRRRSDVGMPPEFDVVGSIVRDVRPALQRRARPRAALRRAAPVRRAAAPEQGAGAEPLGRARSRAVQAMGRRHDHFRAFECHQHHGAAPGLVFGDHRRHEDARIQLLDRVAALAHGHDEKPRRGHLPRRRSAETNRETEHVRGRAAVGALFAQEHRVRARFALARPATATASDPLAPRPASSHAPATSSPSSTARNSCGTLTTTTSCSRAGRRCISRG